MDNFELVEIISGFDELQQIALGFQLCQSLSPPYKLVETLVLAYVEEDVNVLLVLKVLIKEDDVLIVQRLMNLYLAC
jgi:hypothetical protein